MGEEAQITTLFPELKNDLDFKVTSPRTPNYNCIAWAYHHNDRWMWPLFRYYRMPKRLWSALLMDGLFFTVAKTMA